jgi:hypothetical protein
MTIAPSADWTPRDGSWAPWIPATLNAGGQRARRDAAGPAEAPRQLTLRYAVALAVAGAFPGGGFDVVVEDVIIGSVLPEFLGMVPVPESIWCSSTRTPAASARPHPADRSPDGRVVQKTAVQAVRWVMNTNS